MKTKTPITPAPTRIVTSTGADAARYLREYFKNANFSSNSSYYTVGTSKARHASVAQMVSWFRQNRNIALDAGWFGRSLNAAQSAGLAVTVGTATDHTTGREILVYRNARS